MAAYHAACGNTEQPVLTVVKKAPRLRTNAEVSIDWLAEKYFGSDQWKRLSTDSQNGRPRMLERFRADHGDKPLDGLPNQRNDPSTWGELRPSVCVEPRLVGGGAASQCLARPELMPGLLIRPSGRLAVPDQTTVWTPRSRPVSALSGRI
jgi:hypothetical protein